MTQQHLHTERFLTETFHRALVPGVLSILGGNLNILADGILVGQRLGSDGLSAVNLCLPLYLVVCIFGSWVVSGTAMGAARALGAGKQREGDWYGHQALALCLLVSAVLTLAGGLFLKQIVALLCADRGLRPLVHAYAWTGVLGVLPRVLLYIPFWYLRMDGKNRSITAMMVLMGLGNVVLDILFLYVLDLGVLGAGLASVAATAAAVVFGFWQLYGRRKNFTLGLALPGGRSQLREITAAGSPSAMNNLFQTCRVLTINSLLLAAGGSSLVAVFTACNGVAAFGECVLSGVPQAGSAILGSLLGDEDRVSVRALLARQLKSGAMLSAGFAAVTILGADLISAAYGLGVPFRVPMACLSASLLPGLVCTVAVGYYNAAGMNRWANGIVFGRVFLFPALFLFLLRDSGPALWLFLPLGELAAALVWLGLFRLRFRGDRERSWLLRLPVREDSRQVNCSVFGGAAEICSLSERLLELCDRRGVPPQSAMKVSLAVEELMVLIAAENEDRDGDGSGDIVCDLRLRLEEDRTTLTLRYSGRDFNPMLSSGERDGSGLGIQLVEQMLQKVEYQNISGMNILRIMV